MTRDINVTINGGFSVGVVDSGNLGTMDGGTASKDFTIDNVSTNQNVGISDVIVSVDGDPSFSADYEYSYTWSQLWDDGDSHVDVNVTVSWETDPGGGNDIELDYEIRS